MTHPASRCRRRGIPIRPTHQHETVLSLASGDVLVVTTDYNTHASHDASMELLLKVAYSSNIDGFRWQIFTPEYEVSGQDDMVFKTSLIRLTPCLPLESYQHSEKGLCTKFHARITHGYRVHFLDYVKRKIPQVAQQIEEDSWGIYAPLLPDR